MVSSTAYTEAAPPRASSPPEFARLEHELRDHIIEHYERLGEHLDTPAGLLTLDTNSVLAADRARLLLRLLAEQGAGSIAGRRVLDLGAGFGALALYYAHLGAEVVAVDPNEQRMQVAIEIALRHGLALSAVAAHAQSLPFPDESFDLVVANNSLCYIVEPSVYDAALSEIYRVLRPGGWLAIRNPNRLHLRDQFTGLPLLGLLPRTAALRVLDALGRHRSDVRLQSPGAATRQLRRAGFTKARWSAQPGRRVGARFAGYHHLTAQHPPTVPAAEDPNPPLVPQRPQRQPGGGLAASAWRSSEVALGAMQAFAWLKRHWEATLFASMALAFVWMRMVDMQISFLDDEAATVVQYINRGPAGIYSAAGYSPNNHVLYSLLSWVTINILGRSEPTYRIWSVVPAILSAVLFVFWTRKRLGRASALALAAVLLSAPYLLYETVQARGYGLAQLGMVLVLIAAFEIEERGPRRWPLRALTVGIAVGVTAHAMTAAGMIFTVGFLLRRSDLRRPVLKASAVGAAFVVLVLAPLAPSMISQARKYFVAGTHDTRSAQIQKERPPLPLSAPITGPIELGRYTGELVVHGKVRPVCTSACYSSGKLALFDAPMLIFAILGGVALWRWRRRGILGCLLVTLIGGFALPTLTRTYAAERFVLYLLPTYALLAAVGIAALFGAAAHRKLAPKPALLAIAVVLLFVGTLRIYDVNQRWGETPEIDYRGLADAVLGSGVAHAVTNAPPSVADGLAYYLGKRVSFSPPATLQKQLCGSSVPFEFVQLHYPIPVAEERCLEARGGSSLDFNGRSDQVLRLWLIQAPGKAGAPTG
jgi:ubiquinone/menaquinone biosynthesis C-methylase UbiE/4-amino-4-deoxy-L-arabinose transferase-like glycosyltransferase